MTPGVDRARASIDSPNLRPRSYEVQVHFSSYRAALEAAAHPSFTATRLDPRVSVRRGCQLARSLARKVQGYSSRFHFQRVVLLLIAEASRSQSNPPRLAHSAHPRLVRTSGVPREFEEATASRASRAKSKCDFYIKPASPVGLEEPMEDLEIITLLLLSYLDTTDVCSLPLFITYFITYSLLRGLSLSNISFVFYMIV